MDTEIRSFRINERKNSAKIWTLLQIYNKNLS